MRCAHVYDDDKQCGNHALSDSELCFSHDPRERKARRWRAKKAAKTKAKERRKREWRERHFPEYERVSREVKELFSQLGEEELRYRLSRLSEIKRERLLPP